MIVAFFVTFTIISLYLSCQDNKDIDKPQDFRYD